MSDIAIRIEGLGKRYRYGGPQPLSYNLRQDITDWVRGTFTPQRRRAQGDNLSDLRASAVKNPSHPTPHQIHAERLAHDPNCFWALKDINLEIKQGEVVGIIGRNGAGKSTLLKILSRITPPTTGRAECCSRVASLLEIGTGFHRELTGRENIYLNGSIMGMKRVEIAKKFDEIVAFAEVEKFIDTPVKFYSSGMYVRLAFAVAAHLEPEILLVDEVLAVGDAEFQRKCLGKMGEVAQQGRTICFVSHNMTAIIAFCERAVWLNSGRIMANGPCPQVVTDYVKSGGAMELERHWGDSFQGGGDDKVRPRSVRVQPLGDAEARMITINAPVQLEFEYWNYREGALLNLSISFKSTEGVCVFATVTPPERLPAGLIRSVCRIPARLLNDSLYYVNWLIVENESQVLFRAENVVSFEAHELERDINWHGKWPGLLRPALEWNTKVIRGDAPDSPACRQVGA